MFLKATLILKDIPGTLEWKGGSENGDKAREESVLVLISDYKVL